MKTFWHAVVCLAILLAAPPALAQAAGLPTPTMNEREMRDTCDVAAEGRITAVKLVKRWIGNRPGIDQGYEQGDFECSLLVEKPIKGKYEPSETLKYIVHAYMEGKWDHPPPMGFVYQNTQAAITPGTKLRVYLKWNASEKVYERVHFNSGFVVMKASDEPFPNKEGETVQAKDNK